MIPRGKVCAGWRWSLLLLLAGCASVPPGRLYDELGGQPGIEALVEDLLFVLADDRRIAHHFAGVDVLRLRGKLIEQFCAEAGGPCVYRGADMRTAHAGLDIREADFNALVEDLIQVMESRGLPVRVQNRLLRRLAPMHGDIVRH